MKRQDEINYTIYGKAAIFVITSLALGVFQIMLFILYKGKGSVFVESIADSGLFFRRIIVDRILIESISILLLFFLTWRFGRYIGLNYPSSFREKAKYYLRYLPIQLLSLAIFIFAAIFLRHLWRFDFEINEEILSGNYGNYVNVYLQSLLPFLAVTYAVLGFNLYGLRSRKSTKFREGKIESIEEQPPTSDVLEVVNENGNIPIKVRTIEWIEKKSRICEVKTHGKTYSLRKTIRVLEELLEPHGFVRINRRVLVNKDYVYNYSYWEHDKFILRMKDDRATEFIVSRDRMKQIKTRLAKDSVPQ